MIDYFERNGAPKCPPEENPAEWMLNITLPSGNGPNWFDIWRSSPEREEVKAELGRLRQGKSKVASVSADGDFASQHSEFVASFPTQLWIVLLRTLKHFWRSPTYLWSKLSLTILFVRSSRFNELRTRPSKES